MAQTTRAPNNGHMVATTSPTDSKFREEDACLSDGMSQSQAQNPREAIYASNAGQARVRRDIVQLAVKLNTSLLLAKLQVLFQEMHYDDMSLVIDQARTMAELLSDDLIRAKCDVWTGIVHFEHGCTQSAVKSFISAYPIVPNHVCFEADVLPYYLQELKTSIEEYIAECNNGRRDSAFLKCVDELIHGRNKPRSNDYPARRTQYNSTSNSKHSDDYMMEEQLLNNNPKDDELSATDYGRWRNDSLLPLDIKNILISHRLSDSSDMSADTARRGSDPNFKSVGTVNRERLQQPSRSRSLLHAAVASNRQASISRAPNTSDLATQSADVLTANGETQRSRENQDKYSTQAGDLPRNVSQASQRGAEYEQDLDQALGWLSKARSLSQTESTSGSILASNTEERWSLSLKIDKLLDQLHNAALLQEVQSSNQEVVHDSDLQSNTASMPERTSETLLRSDGAQRMNGQMPDPVVKNTRVDSITSASLVQRPIHKEAEGFRHASAPLPSLSSLKQATVTHPEMSELSDALAPNKALERVRAVNGRDLSHKITTTPLKLVTSGGSLKSQQVTSRVSSKRTSSQPSTPSPLRQTFSPSELPDVLAGDRKN